jgi:hypothetical protein
MYMTEVMSTQDAVSSPKSKSDSLQNGKAKSDGSANRTAVVKNNSWKRAKKVYGNYLVRIGKD